MAALEDRARAVLDAACEAGIRYFDAARSYGRAEEFLASWLDRRKLGGEGRAPLELMPRLRRAAHVVRRPSSNRFSVRLINRAMFDRWRTKIATAAPAANAITGHEAPKARAKRGSVAADSSEATEV